MSGWLRNLFRKGKDELSVEAVYPDLSSSFSDSTAQGAGRNIDWVVVVVVGLLLAYYGG